MAEELWMMGDETEAEFEDEISGPVVDAVMKKVKARLQKEVEAAVREYVTDGFIWIEANDLDVKFYSPEPIEAFKGVGLVELLERVMSGNLDSNETFETAAFAICSDETMAEIGSDPQTEAARSANLKKLRECWRILTDRPRIG